MQSQDIDVLAHCREWLQGGFAPWLCVIVRTIGSSPRPVGSMMACLDDGRQAGSISGGCVEEDLLERLREGAYPGTLPELVEYGVSAEENEKLGLPCGGRLTILLQRLRDEDLKWIGASLDAMDRRQCVVRTLDITTGQQTLSPAERHQALSLQGDQLQHWLGPRMRMLLVGAGQLAHSLAELALAMDYEVIVTDPREDVLAQWEGPDIRRLAGMPDDAVREVASDRNSLVITLTHDPRIDDMALMEALESEAWYIGALGSARTSAKRRERLAQLGLHAELIEKLHAPVGLDIGSKTPIEIAVAIMAQLTRLRRA